MNVLASLFLSAGLLSLTPDVSLENTNIVGYADEYRFVDYNRLRAEMNAEHERYSSLLAKVILDNETFYIEKPSSLRNRASIYRGYVQYRGETHFWSIGRQRIPLGVGRVWNPIDLFNPINSESIEPEQRTGTESVRYEYALSRLANFDCTLAKDQGEARIKGYLEYADIALVAEWDNDEEIDLIGWELEGEWLSTGIELRSEGGSFHNDRTGERSVEFIAGAEYGFANSLVLLGEYYYSDETKIDQMALSASYQFSMLWTGSLLAVQNLDDHSFFITPSVSYSAADDMTISAGAFFYHGGSDDLYGDAGEQVYLRWFVHF